MEFGILQNLNISRRTCTTSSKFHWNRTGCHAVFIPLEPFVSTSSATLFKRNVYFFLFTSPSRVERFIFKPELPRARG